MKNKRILILGATGMLGHSLMLSLSEMDQYDVWGSCRSKPDISIGFPSHLMNKLVQDIDVNRDLSVLDKLAENLAPEIIINCIGAIKQKNDAFQVPDFIYLNALFPHLLLNLCKGRKIRLIHISTDCVFDGGVGNYSEESPMSARDIYGISKFLGEFSSQDSLTIRASIVGHELEGSLSLFNWFLSQSQTIQGYGNVLYNGLTTKEFGQIMAKHILSNELLTGLLHLSSSQAISKYDLLILVSRIYKKEIVIELNTEKVENKTLDDAKFNRITGYVSPSWEEMVKDLKNQFDLLNYKVKDQKHV